MTASLDRELRCDEIQDDLPAYALDALELFERDAVQRHLAACIACRTELERLSAVVGALEFATPRVPPDASVRARLMADIDAESGERPPAALATARGRVIQFRGWTIAAAALAAALVIGLITTGVLLRRTIDQRDDARAQSARVEAYLSAGGTLLTLSTEQSSIYDTSTGKGSLLTAPGMPPMIIVQGCAPSTGYLSYHLWVSKNGLRSPAGTLTVDSSGRGLASLTLTAPLSNFDGLGVTAVTSDSKKQDVLVGSIQAGSAG